MSNPIQIEGKYKVIQYDESENYRHENDIVYAKFDYEDDWSTFFTDYTGDGDWGTFSVTLLSDVSGETIEFKMESGHFGTEILTDYIDTSVFLPSEVQPEITFDYLTQNKK